MNQYTLFLSFYLVLVFPAFASTAPEFKIRMKQEDGVKRKIALEQRLQEIQQLKNTKEQAINTLDNNIKDAKYEIVSLGLEFKEYPEDPKIQQQITKDLNEFKEKLKQYENQRRWLQEDNEELSKEAADINDQLNKLL